jgi:hypothetical protein
MALKIENSRRVAESRPVCMGLNACVVGTTEVWSISRIKIRPILVSHARKRQF